MFNFNFGFLREIWSCEMKNFDGPIWFLQDMCISERISSVSVRSTLNLNHSKLTYLTLAGVINTAVKRKNSISTIYSLIEQKIFMQFYHIEWSKVKEIKKLIGLRFSLFNNFETDDNGSHDLFPETNYTIFLNKKVNRPIICFLYRFCIYINCSTTENPSKNKKVSTDLIYLLYFYNYITTKHETSPIWLKAMNFEN